MITAKTPIRLTLTIRRPNGDLEKVVHPTLKTITDAQFRQIQKATAEAGRGNVFDYKIDYKESKVYRNIAEAIAANEKMGEVEAAMTINGTSK